MHRREDEYEIIDEGYCNDCKETVEITYEDFGFDYWGHDGKTKTKKDFRAVCAECKSIDVDIQGRKRMIIQKILSKHKRQGSTTFFAIFECENCGSTVNGPGFDDEDFYERVIPTLKCKDCKRIAPKGGNNGNQVHN